MSEPFSSPDEDTPQKGFVSPLVDDLDKVLDAYDFLEILGRGGMGAVYKARQTSLDRIVAIKILPSFEGKDEHRFAERFQREAQAMGRLTHPNIISVYDFGQTTDGQLYIVMEYVEGKDLSELIKTGELNEEHLFGWVPQICDALQYAHSRGIIHRDIKPANIMITMDGVVKVADFGLAKLTDPSETQTQLTMTNVAMGTPDYVAPEMLEEGMEADHRADLYALGVMLYQLLTGKVPRGAWRSPSKLFPSIDPRFDELVERAMDSDPDSRFQSASEIRSQLDEISRGPLPPRSDPEAGVGQLPSPVPGKSLIMPSGSSGAFQQVSSTPGKGSPKKSVSSVVVASASAVMAAAIGLVFWLNRDAPTVAPFSISENRGSEVPTVTDSDPEKALPNEIEAPVSPRPEVTAPQVVAIATPSPVEEDVLPKPTAVGMPESGREDPEAGDFPPRPTAPFTEEEAVGYQMSWADYLETALEFRNSVGMQFRLIPPGAFGRGQAADVRTEMLAPIYIGAYEVTQREYEAVMGDNPSSFAETGEKAEPVAGMTTLLLPVESLSPSQIAIYCNRLSELEGLAPCYEPVVDSSSPILPILDGTGYRLPTAHELEWASRAGMATPEPSLAETAWYEGNSGGRPHNVGGKLPNSFGLFDTLGNVGEYVLGESSPREGELFARTGGYGTVAEEVATWRIGGRSPVNSEVDLGFRLVRSVNASSRPEVDAFTDLDLTRHPAQVELARISDSLSSAEERVDPNIEEAWGRLEAQFVNALERNRDRSQGAERDAFLADLERVQNRENIPETDPIDLPASLKSLRATWRTETAKYEQLRSDSVRQALSEPTEALRQAAARYREDGLTYYSREADRLLVEYQSAPVEMPQGEDGKVDTESVAKAEGANPQDALVGAEWVSLFDGKSLEGWTPAKDSKSFSVDFGDLVIEGGEIDYLLYTGPVAFGGQFRDFDFRAEVKTENAANSGVLIHSEPRSGDIPELGFEVQIDNSEGSVSGTGSVDRIALVDGSPVVDGEWFSLEIRVRGAQLTTSINGQKIVDSERASEMPPQQLKSWLSGGALALQASPPSTGLVRFRSIEVRTGVDEITQECLTTDSTAITRARRDLSSLPRGRLHTFGTSVDGEPLDLGDATPNKFVEVAFGSGGQWQALDSGGRLYSNGSSDDDRFKNVTDFTRGTDTLILYEDGRVWQLQNGGEGVSWPHLDNDQIVAVASGNSMKAALDAEGRISVLRHRVYMPDHVHPLGRTDIVGLWCNGQIGVGLRANGKLAAWGQFSPALFSEPVREAQFVDIDCHYYTTTLIGLTTGGDVLTWGYPENGSFLKVPSEQIGKATAVAAGVTVCAARREEDGRWVAWGSDPYGLAAKINSLGPDVIHLAIDERSLIWIE